jgi:hypothetical protein
VGGAGGICVRDAIQAGAWRGVTGAREELCRSVSPPPPASPSTKGGLMTRWDERTAEVELLQPLILRHLRVASREGTRGRESRRGLGRVAHRGERMKGAG